jgi:hypothetical protein
MALLLIFSEQEQRGKPAAGVTIASGSQQSISILALPKGVSTWQKNWCLQLCSQPPFQQARYLSIN